MKNLISCIPWHYLFKPRKKGGNSGKKRHKETESRGHLDLMMMCFKHVFGAFLGNILNPTTKKTWMTKSFCNISVYTFDKVMNHLDELCVEKKHASKMADLYDSDIVCYLHLGVEISVTNINSR